jgi:aminomethyltransferase
MIAIQGPRSLQILEPLFNQPLAPLAYYHLSMGRLLGTCDAVISRTGYTGEDGFEIIVGASRALEVWDALLKAGAEHGITPCGLGARDTLRLEAAMPLYGHELTEAINPFAAGLHWAVKFDKGDFVGREPLAALQANPGQKRIGLRLASKRIARQDTVVLKGDDPAGVVTSGTFSPTLEQSIAMALVDPTAATVGQELTLEIRGHREPARVVKLPFYRRPKSEAAASA